MRLGIKEIQEIIPHRHPFLLIDFIDELEPGVRAVGYKSITFNEPQFNGHFPGQPVMPGVLMIEALAQVGGGSHLKPAGEQRQDRIFRCDQQREIQTDGTAGDRLEAGVRDHQAQRPGRRRQGRCDQRRRKGCSISRADLCDSVRSGNRRVEVRECLIKS